MRAGQAGTVTGGRRRCQAPRGHTRRTPEHHRLSFSFQARVRRHRKDVSTNCVTVIYPAMFITALDVPGLFWAALERGKLSEGRWTFEVLDKHAGHPLCCHAVLAHPQHAAAGTGARTQPRCAAPASCRLTRRTASQLAQRCRSSDVRTAKY